MKPTPFSPDVNPTPDSDLDRDVRRPPLDAPEFIAKAAPFQSVRDLLKRWLGGPTRGGAESAHSVAGLSPSEGSHATGDSDTLPEIDLSNASQTDNWQTSVK